jgi:hypothetical protein
MKNYKALLSAIILMSLSSCLSARTDQIEAGDKEVILNDWKTQYHQLKGRISKKSSVPASQVLNIQSMILDSDRTPLDVVLRRTEALFVRLNGMDNASELLQLERELRAIKAKRRQSGQDDLALYLEVKHIARQAILADPLLNFDDLLFLARGVLNDHKERKSEYDGDHFCDQYYGHNGRKDGGIFIVKDFKSDHPEIIELAKGLRVPGGTNQGALLSEGTFVSPDLSWDGKTVVFGWSSGGTEKWDPKNRFNIFSVNVDGSNLMRLTDGDYDDIHPCWLPNGRIVFISTRRCGYGRCHGRPVPAYTMFSMKADGSDLINIDYHETNEFHPSVDNNGMLVYTRWDYVDRDHSAAHHMWHCYPDGRDPRSFHANYPLPLSTVGGEPRPNGLHLRPWAEFNCRSIPGSNKYVATAGPHHGQAFGSLVLIDIAMLDDNKMSQVKRITPEVKFPESETGTRHWDDMAYGTCWPLSERLFLTNYKDGVYVLDELGNRELLCKVTNGLRAIDPIPFRARRTPPVIPTETYQGERFAQNRSEATISVMNVYVADEYGKLPKGTDIKALRVVQVLPKSTPNANNPRIGFGDQSLARIPLGVVPVEKDGSVFFKAPIEKAVYFQLLDKNGMAVQSMRSVTYVHPGEKMTCVGCHEDKQESPKINSMPLAMKRQPSELKPEVEDHVMFGFHKNVRPVLENKCVSCHEAQDVEPKSMTYIDLEKYMFYLGHGYRNKLHGGSRIKPGEFGALFSLMGKTLLDETHQKALKEGIFTKEDCRAIVLWLDLNSNEFSAYKDIASQKEGKIVWPEFDVDPDNYSGVERHLQGK